MPENITDKSCVDAMMEGAARYSKYVIFNRQFADLRDGLLPVQRFIIWSSHQLDNPAKRDYVKCARIVGDTIGRLHPHGDCLRGSTLIPLLNGKTVSIRDLCNQKAGAQWVLAYNPKTGKLQPAQAHSWRVGQTTAEMYRLHMSNGDTLECTKNHEFYIKGEEWVRSENMVANDPILGGVIRHSPSGYQDLCFNDEVEPLHVSIGRNLAQEVYAYRMMRVIKAYRMMRVIKVEKIRLKSPEKFYDFTVNGLHNMIVMSPKSGNKTLQAFYVAHNSSAYGALCGLTRKHTMLAPIEGEGNFGSLIDKAAGYRYCLPANQRVWTDNGLIQIGDKSIVGRHTLGLNGKPSKIIKWLNSGFHPTLRVTTKNGYSLTSTYNHPYLTLRKITGKYVHKWMEAGDLRLGDMVCTQGIGLHNAAQYQKIKIGVHKVFDENFAELLGMLISDGYHNNNRFIGFGNTDVKCLDRFRLLWKKTINKPLKTRRIPVGKSSGFKSTKDYCMLEYNSVEFAQSLSSIGYKKGNSYTVEVPTPIWTSPTSVVAAFLRGLWEGDGSGLYYVSVNETLLLQIKELLLAFFGIHTSAITVNRGNAKAIRVFGAHARTFFEEIGQGKFIKASLRNIPFTSGKGYRSERAIGVVPCDNADDGWSVRSKFRSDYERRLNISETIGNRIKKQDYYLVNHHDIYDCDYDYQEIISLTSKGEQEVFDITTHDHSFTANGFIVHNTDARLSDYGLTFVDKRYLDTVPYVSNYDGKEMVPVYLPALLPNILLNGAFGIGYGYMSDIPSFTRESVSKLTAKAFLGDITVKQCRILEPCFVNNARYVDNGALQTFFETGEATMRVEPKIEVHGKDIHVVGVYALNLLSFAEKLNLHPDVRSVSDSSNGDDDRIPVRLLVQCSRNVEEVKTLVLKALSSSKPLRANLLTNNILPDYQHDNETLPSKLDLYPMPELIGKWIDYRVNIERKMLTQSFEDHGKKIYRLDALISTSGRLKELAALLEENLPTAELTTRISRLLHCEPQQAILVMDAALRRLASIEILQLKQERAVHLAEQGKLKTKIGTIYKTTAISVASSFAALK